MPGFFRRFGKANALLLLAAGLALPACQRPEEPARPADLLLRPKMVSVLIGLHLLEARASGVRLSTDSARALYRTEEQALMRRHAASDSAFQRSYRYYMYHGKEMEEIYQEVVDSLAQRERALNGGQVAPELPYHK